MPPLKVQWKREPLEEHWALGHLNSIHACSIGRAGTNMRTTPPRFVPRDVCGCTLRKARNGIRPASLALGIFVTEVVTKAGGRELMVIPMAYYHAFKKHYITK
eukprot:4418050-Amphidinium_carterae.5